MSSYGESTSRLPEWFQKGLIYAAADSTGRKGWIHPSQSQAKFPAHKVGDPDYGTLPKLRKRTPQERLESLTKRLVDAWKTQPWLVDGLLAEIQGEYWKAGAPVSADQLRALAGSNLNEAERRVK